MDLFILAGEASGDLHGASLLAAMRRRKSDLRVFGVAGPRMRAQGVESLLQTEDFALMGITDVLRALPRIRTQLRLLTSRILLRRPPLVVLIDYAGFNIRLAKRLRKAGYRGAIVQYISPKVWAWGRHRIRDLAAHFDLLLTIFPFEAVHFEGSGLRVEYVGNPLIEERANYHYTSRWKEQLGLKADCPLIGLFPGSRQSEIRLNTRKQLEAARALAQHNPNLHFAISVANERIEEALRDIAREVPLPLHFIPATEGYNLMANCEAAIATSGTVNLELALHAVPHVVVYAVSHLNALLARFLLRVKLPHYSIANFVHGETFLPELIYLQFTAKKAAYHLRQLLEDGPSRRACLAGCERVGEHLQTDRPSERATDLLLPFLITSHC